MAENYKPTPPSVVHQKVVQDENQNQDHELLRLINEAIEGYGIEGYKVRYVELALPPRTNPDYCAFYFQFDDGGFKFGITCTSEDD